MLQRIDLCMFQPKVYALAFVDSSRWHSRTKTGKSKEMFTINKKYTRCKRLACRVALEYCLKKDSPCCSEWIDMCYKCIRDLIWMSMEPLHGYTCLYKRARNSSFKTAIEAYLLIKWL